MAHMYLDETIANSAPGTRHVLGGSEGRHASTVARLRVGEAVRLGNGRGLVLETTVESVERDSVTLCVANVSEIPARTPRLILAQALAKTDRDERAVEASVEVGVDGIVPWQADRSVSRWDSARAQKGRAKWQNIAREAAKQSLAAWIPEVEDVCSTAQLVARANTRWVVLDASGEPLSALPWSEWSTQPQDTLLIVGPEGGFSAGDMGDLVAAGARIARLGPQILRTSTAGPVAVALASEAMGRWA